MAMNKKANAILKKKFMDMGITQCEVTGATEGLTWMHRKKRRFYNTVEELSDFNEVLLVTLAVHQKYEFDREATELLFKQLR